MLKDELRSTFLFEQLSDEQLDTLLALGKEVTFPADELVFNEGEPADYLWVLLEGEMELTRHVGGQRIHVETLTRPGTYAGGIRAFAASGTGMGYRATGRITRPSRFFRLASGDLGRLLDTWLPMAKHLLDGYVHTCEFIEVAVRERGHLISLGTLAAGLAHELNNPAAAARSASADLRAIVGRLEARGGWLATGDLTPAQVRAGLDLQADAASRSATTPRRSAIETGRLEEEVGDWLEAHDVPNQWELAPTFVAAGLDLPWLDMAAGRIGDGNLGGVLSWIADTLLASALLEQIEDATGRIAQLISVAKDYSYLDRAAEQQIDIHEGIEKTLAILGHKLRGGVEVVRGYDERLPRIVGNGSELNQVWTNLIDNAIDAMDGHGQIHIRTSHDEHAVLVEIRDQGRGIPPELASRIFDPFFTTKDVGQGTGLGLDIVRRIVVDHSGGEVSFESEPGATRFLVRLPRASDS